MKKLILFIAILLLNSCLLPTPEIAGNINYFIEDTIKADTIKTDTIKNTIKKEKLSKKEEAKEVQKIHEQRQKNVMNNLKTLEKQQVMLDSLLKTKKDIEK